MITNTGQSILAKYLVGQAPAYASYIAVGCGSTPVSSSHVFSEAEMDSMKAKESLDFEMFRVPVTSRGYVTENGVSKIVFTGELPTLERYDITEVGIWSAGSNPSANFNDSRTIFLFITQRKRHLLYHLMKVLYTQEIMLLIKQMWFFRQIQTTLFLQSQSAKKGERVVDF